MHSSEHDPSVDSEGGEVDPTQSRYSDWETVIGSATQHEDWPDGEIIRIELNMLSNGQGTWRVWTPDSDEPIGGVYAGDQGG